MPRKKVDRLAFVFDAYSGLLATLVDGVKKVLADGCPLCSITHGLLRERREWIECKESLRVPVDYFHRDQVPEALKNVVEGMFPCVVAVAQGEPFLVLDPVAISRCKGSCADFKGRLIHHAALRGLELPNMLAPMNLVAEGS